ncbi:MAG: YncE family protein [Myxococcales bacterium]|nr:YncE family protein [Myxococcales bacterium]
MRNWAGSATLGATMVAILAVAVSGCGTAADPADAAVASDAATGAETATADGTAAETASGDTGVGAETATADAVADTAVVDTPVADGAADVPPADVPPADVPPADVPPADVAVDAVVAPPILPGPSRGSSIAVSPDDNIVITCNRDSGSVTVLKAAYAPGVPTKLTKSVDIAVGAEPWQVAIAPDSDSAWVVVRAEQKVVQITGLKTTPKVGASVTVGSEPTGLALTPTGKFLAVANWVDGTISLVDTASAKVFVTVDLNAALVGSKVLGDVKSRPGLAHPRSIAITNNGDANDLDESMIVTEWYSQRAAELAADGSNADTARKGIVYRINGADMKVTVIDVPALADMGFKDHAGNVAGCFPNQLQAVAINGDWAFVSSVCASPKGLLGPFTGPAAKVCALDADCPGAGVGSCATLKCKTNCAADADCGANGGKCTANACEVNPASVKTAIGNVLSVIDLKKNVTASSINLNAKFNDLYVEKQVKDDNSRRFPLVMTDIGFVPDTGIGYASANGSDAVFRFKFNIDGTLAEVGSTVQLFIDLVNPNYDAKVGGRGPTGLAIPNINKKVAFVNNDFTRNVTVADFATQEIAGGPATPSVTTTADMPAAASEGEKVLLGKRFFNTGLGRWSLKGQSWNSCQTCHIDGLTDNVTWFFGRGPRQSTSLDGSFNSKDPKDQRIFNWTAVFDEVADFELNTRGTSGGVGAIVHKKTAPIGSGDRIDIAALGHAGLNGSAAAVADPKSGIVTPPSVLEDWSEITKYIQSLRSPRGVTGLDAAKVAEGKAIYQDSNCAGCHGGAKWTISKLFYSPSVDGNKALLTKKWAAPQYFPVSLLPAATEANRFMRFSSGNPAGLDQIQCILRPVGTFKTCEPGVGIAELRTDMKAVGQGAEIDGNGYNPPSLLNLAAGGPYYHAGNAMTLESLLSNTFVKHHTALAANLLQETDPAKKQATVDKLVAYLLSIDETTAVIAAPATAGGTGGDFCTY